MTKNISAIITEACKDNDIPYVSSHCFFNDAGRLKEIIDDIEILSTELYNILERHNIEHKLKLDIENDIEKLHKIDHDLIKLAKKIKKE